MRAPVPAPQPAQAQLPVNQQVAVAGTLAALGVALVGLWLVLGATGDRGLSSAAQAARAVVFERAAPLLLTPVSREERTGALQGMQLQADQQQALEQRRVELVWLTLWDDVEEDGDTVRISSGGFQQSVRLAHQPIRIAVPRPPDGVIWITGTEDGGGGITLAVATAAGQLAVPVLAPGQTIGLKVR